MINAANNVGDTALLIAVRKRHVAIVQRLKLGADFKHRNNAGESALSLAQGHPELEGMISSAIEEYLLSLSAGSPAASRAGSPAASGAASDAPVRRSERIRKPSQVLEGYAWKNA